ncbi:MAG: DNRLRE domain-containing protein [Cycloclasticus sp.]
MGRFTLNRGFILIPVVLTLTLLAAIAFMLSRQGAINADSVVREHQPDVAAYVAEAGLSHALWQANQANCTGYSNLTNVALGQHAYSTTTTPSTGSPVTVQTVGTHALGASHTLNLTGQRIYEPTPSTVILQPDAAGGKDTYIYEWKPDWNYGLNSELWVNDVSSDSTYLSLLEFDLTGLPATAHILTATLELYQSRTSADGGAISAHRITNAWAQGVNANGTGASNWTESDTAISWTTPGGDYDTTAVTITTLAGTVGWSQWDIAALVQDWVDGKYPNQGFMLNPAPGASAYFYSSDYTGDVTLRPKLTISYQCECGSGGTASSKELFPVDDTYMAIGNKAGLQTTNFSTKPEVIIGTHTNTERALLRFDTAAIPSNAIVTSATLDMYYKSSGTANDGVIEAYRVTEAWINSQVTWDSPQTGLTWAGGNYNTTIIASAPVSEALTNTVIPFDITSLVQTWHTDEEDNLGVLLAAKDTVVKYGTGRFASTDDATASLHPKLTVNYSCPCGGCAVVLVDKLVLSTDVAAELAGVSFTANQLVEYDPNTPSAALFPQPSPFDASVNIDAAHVLENGNIAFSTTASATLGGTSFDDDDLLVYEPSTGNVTMLIDGSAVFSGATDFDIDAVYIRSNGLIVLSTRFDATLGGLAFGDGDLVEYNRLSNKATLLFDGEALFTDPVEDIDAVYIFDDGQIALSTQTDAILGGLSFADGDVVKYDPVSNTAELYFAETNFTDIAADLDALHIGIAKGSTVVEPCNADYLANGVVSEFSAGAYGSLAQKDLDYMPEGSIFHNHTIPFGGAWVSVDRDDQLFYLNNMDGGLITTLAGTSSMRGVAFIGSGTWAGYVAAVDSVANDVRYYSPEGTMDGSFNLPASALNGNGAAFIDVTSSGLYEGHLAISDGDSNSIYIINQAGALQATLDLTAFVIDLRDVAHIPNSDKLLVLDQAKKVFIVDLDGTKTGEYDLASFDISRTVGVAINPLTCDHVVADDELDKTVVLNQTGEGALESPATLNPSADNYIISGQTTNYGADTLLQLGRTGGAGRDMHALFMFDVSGIPAGSLINSASLRLYAAARNGADSFNLKVHQVTQDWTESGSNWSDADDPIAWTAGGGGTYGATVIDSIPAAATGWYEWNIAPLVQEWVEDPPVSANQGLIVIHTTVAKDNLLKIDSKEGTNKPELVIDFTPP